MSIEDIKELVKQMNNLCADLGYITTRTYLPEQNLSSGRLLTMIKEGVIESIKAQNTNPIDHLNTSHEKEKRVKTGNLPIRIGKILNLRDIEQSIDILNTTHSDATIDLEPGSKAEGSILFIRDATNKNLSITLGVDN